MGWRKLSSHDLGGSGAQTHEKVSASKKHVVRHEILYMSHCVPLGKLGACGPGPLQLTQQCVEEKECFVHQCRRAGREGAGMEERGRGDWKGRGG